MPGERSSPLTVILPVYNAAPYLSQCIDSLLAQTYRNFKLLIVDDGSTDDSPKIIDEYAQRDARIRPTLNRQNQGLIRVLNTAIAKCESPFVARMDADDWCEPDRLALQMAFLESHAEVAIVGSWIELFGEKQEVWHYRQQDAFIKALLLFKTNGFPHNSLLARTEVLQRFPYDAAFHHVEDTELWTRIIMQAPECQFANIPRVLTHYRIYGGQVSQRFRDEQDACYARILKRLLSWVLGRDITDLEWQSHCQLMLAQPEPPLEHAQIEDWYGTLWEHYQQRCGDPYFVIQEKWVHYCRHFGLEALFRASLKRSTSFGFLHCRDWYQ